MHAIGSGLQLKIKVEFVSGSWSIHIMNYE
jgi:hypothetical protein